MMQSNLAIDIGLVHNLLEQVNVTKDFFWQLHLFFNSFVLNNYLY